MTEMLVSENNKEFLEDVSPSRLQHLISEIFRLILARNEDLGLRNSLGKKLKIYSKNCQIPLPICDDELEDKILEDLLDREKERSNLEDDILDELKIYDLTVIRDFWRKYARKMLNVLVKKIDHKKGEKYDERLIDCRIPS
jgi:hypothetical protein